MFRIEDVQFRTENKQNIKYIDSSIYFLLWLFKLFAKIIDQ